jgi:Carbohydrate esterase, sialic acid-specific acetylesterase/Putative Ig domain
MADTSDLLAQPVLTDLLDRANALRAQLDPLMDLLDRADEVNAELALLTDLLNRTDQVHANLDPLINTYENLVQAITTEINGLDAGSDVLLWVGQSNNSWYSGTAPDPALDYSDPRILMFPGAGTYLNQSVLANDPIVTGDAATRTQIGNVMSFARNYVQTIPFNRRLLIVNRAVGGTAFTGNRWTAGNPGGDLYEAAIAAANAAIASGPNNRLALIHWLQGESDAIGGMSTQQYSDNIDAMIAGFRARITGAANVPLVATGMVPEWIANSETNATPAAKEAIRQSHLGLPNRVPLSAYVPGPSGYANPPNNTVHYTGAGQRVIGKRILSIGLPAARANIAGVAPQAPVLGNVSAITFTGFTVNWTNGPVQFGVTTAVKYRLVGQTAWTSQTVAAGATSHVLPGLSSGLTYEYRVEATNASGSATSSTGTQAMPALPVVTSPASVIADVGVPFVYQILASYSPTSFSATGLPAWATLDAQTGVISGTPTASGTVSLSVSATNANGAGGPLAVTLKVNAAPSYAVTTRALASNAVLAGTKISALPDVSGNARDWTQIVAARQPTLGVVNGLQVATFATDNLLDNAGLPAANGSYSKILLFQPTASSLAAFENYMSGYVSSNNNHILWKGANATTRAANHNSTNAATSALGTRNPANDVGQWIMLAVTYDAAANLMTVYENGVAGPAKTVTAKPAGAAVSLGALAVNGISGAPMHVLEAQIAPVALSAAQIATEKARLADAYGITLS